MLEGKKERQKKISLVKVVMDVNKYMWVGFFIDLDFFSFLFSFLFFLFYLLLFVFYIFMVFFILFLSTFGFLCDFSHFVFWVFI
jgi:hypothetical protein